MQEVRVTLANTVLRFYHQRKDADVVAGNLTKLSCHPFRVLPTEHGFLIEHEETGTLYDAAGRIRNPQGEYLKRGDLGIDS